MGGAGWRTGCSSTLEPPCSSLTPQSLFERQGLPGPEKLPGSLRKGIPRTKSVGTAGLRDRLGLGMVGLGWVDSGLEDPISLCEGQGCHFVYGSEAALPTRDVPWEDTFEIPFPSLPLPIPGYPLVLLFLSITSALHR